MPATTASNAPDYAQLLHDELLTTRTAVLDRLGQADAATSTALGAYNVTRQTFSDASLALAESQSTGRVAAYLDRQLVDASLTAADAVSLAANSHTKAQAATAAMALAAGNIKAATLALDTLTNTINGVAGVAKSNDDKHEPVEEAASAAVVAVGKVAHAVEVLLSLSLAANVEASRPKTAAALQAVTASRTSVDGIRTGAADAYTASQAAIEAAQTARAADFSDQFTHNTQFTIAARESAALATALQTIDRVANFGLSARPQNTFRTQNGRQIEVAGIEASCELPAAIAADTAEVRFFAVPARAAASFDFHTARRAHHVSFPLKGAARAGKAVACSVQISKDTDKSDLHFGQSYVVFYLRIPGRGESGRGGEPRPTDFSFPTPPLVATVGLSFPAAPVVFNLPNGAFVTAFEAAQNEGYVSSYQVFFSPADTVLMTSQQELLVANQLTAASFTTLEAVTHACTKPGEVAAAIARQFRRDMEPLGRVHTPPLDAALVRFQNWIKQRAKSKTRTYVLYTNPFAVKSGWVAAGGFTIGRSADLNGDPLVPDRRPYAALALAVGSLDKELLQQAANIVSPGSKPFPAASSARLPVNGKSSKRRRPKRSSKKRGQRQPVSVATYPADNA